MAEIRRSGTWGSSLSADELAGVRSVGFEPVGQVLGAALHETGVQAGLEKAYRQLALFAQTSDEKIQYADLANAVRPVTLF